jgi:hypothetical protein
VKKDYDDDRPPLIAKKYYTIWTKENPDIYYHLDKLFSSSEEIRGARLSELENFEKQIAPLALQVCILNSIMPSLFDIEKGVETSVGMNEWMITEAISQQEVLFPDISTEITEKILSCRFDRPFQIDENILDNNNLVPAFDTSKYANILDNELGGIVERKRKELDRLQSEVYVLFEIAYWIPKWYCKPDNFEEEPLKKRWPNIREFITLFTLKNIPKRIMNDIRLRQFLRKFELPEENIETVIREGSRPFHRISSKLCCKRINQKIFYRLPPLALIDLSSLIRKYLP